MIDNPVRGRFNAWFLAAIDGYLHAKYAHIKSRMLSGTPPVIVEIGPGAGANLRYMPRGTRLIAVEPNRRMHPLLRWKARKLGIDLDLRGLAGENMDLPNASADFVFSSLVLCTVDDPQKVVAEIHRILKPGGTFACVEHVEAPAGSRLRRFQWTIRKPWRWVFEGCDLCRDTGALLRSAGFSKVEVNPLVLPTVFFPIRHQITAVCTR